LGDNSLTQLPGEVSGLAALEEAKCADNRLTALPPQLGALTNLMFLCMGSNR
jgi:Leucine-rich repeat (LRR) protein